MANNKKAPALIKRDYTDNWKKALNYIPPIGVIIIYDNHNGSVDAFKFGDGKTLVNDLPNLLKRSARINEEDEELLEL